MKPRVAVECVVCGGWVVEVAHCDLWAAREDFAFLVDGCVACVVGKAEADFCAWYDLSDGVAACVASVGQRVAGDYRAGFGHAVALFEGCAGEAAFH